MRVGATVAVGQLPTLLGVDSNFRGHGLLPFHQCGNRGVAVDERSDPRALRVPSPCCSDSNASLRAFRTAHRSWRRESCSSPSPGGRRRHRSRSPSAQELPMPSLPALGDVVALIPGALAIAVMAFLESAAVPAASARPVRSRSTATRSCWPPPPRASPDHSSPRSGGRLRKRGELLARARARRCDAVTVALAVLVALFLGPVLT